MAATPPWGINAEEESSSWQCEGCSFIGKTLTVEFSLITAMSVTNNQSRFRDWLVANGPFALPNITDWLSFPTPRYFWRSNCFTWLNNRPVLEGGPVTWSGQIEVQCFRFGSGINLRSQLSTNMYQNTTCSGSPTTEIYTRDVFVCSPIYWKHKSPISAGGQLLAETTE